jgi:outer membrane lipopolysaccharide assembly protein LptE/RlpB
MKPRPYSRIRRVLLALALAAAVAGCGYQLVRESQAPLPAGLRNLAVPLAQNLTIEAGLEDLFTQALIQTLSADGRIEITSPGIADANLHCSLIELKISPRTYTAAGRIAAERATLAVECSLVLPDSESVVWKTGERRAAEDYPVGDDYLLNEEQKARALQEICRDLSQTVRTLLLDSF